MKILYGIHGMNTYGKASRIYDILSNGKVNVVTLGGNKEIG